MHRCQRERRVFSATHFPIVKLIRALDLGSFFKLTTRERFDWVMPACLLLLSTIGVFFIYSAQFATEQRQWVLQVAWMALGAVIYLTTSLLDYRLCRSRACPSARAGP